MSEPSDGPKTATQLCAATRLMNMGTPSSSDNDNCGAVTARSRERMAGTGGGKKRTPSCNGTDSPDEQSERMQACHWSTIEGESRMTSIADVSMTSHDEIMDELNPKLHGWCNYHRSSMASRTFSDLGPFLFSTLYSWGFRRHPKKGKRWVTDRCRHRRGFRKWGFCTEEGQLFRPIDVKKKRHVKVRNSMNPHIDREHLLNRQRNRGCEQETGIRVSPCGSPRATGSLSA